MAKAGNLNVTLGANTQQFKAQMAKAKASLSTFEKSTVNLRRKLKKLGKSFTKAGKNLSVGLTAPIVALGALAVKSFEDQITAEKRLEDAVGGAAKALKAQAAELQKTTRFGDEATFAVQAQLATLGLTEKQILKLTPLVQDLSARTGKDLVRSAKEVTGALSTGATTLEKYGVELTTTNTLAENADIAIQGLTESVGGQAKLLAGEGIGPIIQMQNALGDLMEQFGAIIAEAIKPFVIKLKELSERFQKLSPETKKMIAIIAGLTAIVGPLLVTLGFIAPALGVIATAFGALSVVIAANPFGALAIAIGVVVAGLIALDAATTELTEKEKKANEVLAQQNKSLAFGKKAFLEREKAKRAAAQEEAQRIELQKKAIALGLKSNATLGQIAAKEKEIAEELKKVAEKAFKARLAFNKFAQDALKGAKIIVDKGVEPLSDSLDMARQRARDLSFAFDETPTQILERQRAAVKAWIDEATAGNKPITDGVREQIAVYDELGRKLDELPAKTQTLAETSKLAMEDLKASAVGFRDAVAGTVATGIGEALGAALAGEDGDEAIKKIFNNLFGLLKQLGQQLIGIGTPLLFVPGLQAQGLAYTVGGIALVAAATFAQAQFEHGGLVTGKTLGLIGEGRGTTRSNPEVVAPLDKLQGMLGQPKAMGGDFMFRIQGKDLIAVQRNQGISNDFIAPGNNFTT